MAIYVFLVIGSIEYKVIAITAGTIPKPKLNGASRMTIRPKSARLGIVIIILLRYITIWASLGRGEIRKPNGTLTIRAKGKLMAII